MEAALAAQDRLIAAQREEIENLRRFVALYEHERGGGLLEVAPVFAPPPPQLPPTTGKKPAASEGEGEGWREASRLRRLLAAEKGRMAAMARENERMADLLSEVDPLCLPPLITFNRTGARC